MLYPLLREALSQISSLVLLVLLSSSLLIYPHLTGLRSPITLFASLRTIEEELLGKVLRDRGRKDSRGSWQSGDCITVKDECVKVQLKKYFLYPTVNRGKSERFS